MRLREHRQTAALHGRRDGAPAPARADRAGWWRAHRPARLAAGLKHMQVTPTTTTARKDDRP